ncbi:hypothetical protein JTE90_003123 [Oedothorax gibbosus]|uniref:Uncharacterized protein n=1 Tax=Oedothorax gibbosus TaxID=931172 RepID=A0AAV6VG58_9ARAC|nr:hypothetical protein JTE90_003123 [Oedothorax gibbosus]
MPIEKDDAARNKDSMQFKHSHNQQRKDIPKNVGSHYLSNFLALSQTVKTLPKVETQKHSKYFKNKPSASEIASGSKRSVKESPRVPSEQKCSKTIKIKTPTKTSTNTVPKTKNEIAHEIKKKPDSGKKEYFDRDSDLRFLSHNMERSRVKDVFPEHLKQSPYCDFEFLSKNEEKLREKPGSSRKFGSPYTKESSFWKKERYSYRHSLPYGKDSDLRKMSKSSREYLDRERYYKHKSDKYDDRKKDYKWPKMEMHSQSKYSWYNKDYVHKKKYAEKPHFSKMRRDYHKEKRDFHLEDYEEVVSLEDSNEDLKVPVHFRKCLVRYLSYAVYNYFRPKWYFLSRKRYVVNCLYATGKKDKVSEKILKELEPRLEEVAGDEEIADNAAIVDEETVKDDLLVDQEEIENIETIDHALLNDGETIEDASGENIETICVTLLNTDNEETIVDAHGENEVIMDDALLGDDNGDVDVENDETLDDALLEDDNDEIIDDVDGENEETLDDALLEDDNGKLLGDIESENDETMEEVLIEDNNGVTIVDDENGETVDGALLFENVETIAEADAENVENIEDDNGENIEDDNGKNIEVTSDENIKKINDALLVDDKTTKDTLDDTNNETIGNTLLDDNEETTNNIPSNDNEGKKENQSISDICETKEDVSATDNSIQTEKISIVKKEVVNESILSPQNKESIEQGSNVHNEDDDEICILHVGKKVKDAICIVIDDQKESDDTGTVQDGSKEKIDVGVVPDNKEKVSGISIVHNDKTDGEDICILHEKVTKSNIAKFVKKFNDVQKQANKITRNYLKLQQISSKKIVPKKKDNLSGMGNNTKKVENENAQSLLTKSNQASINDKKDPLFFHKCDSSLDFNSEFKHSEPAIQSNLSEWNSHLIGLEYMLEVQDNVDEKVIKKYHCGLCTEDFPHQETIAQVVIKHVTSYKHMCNYMAKHFPSSDYNFSESVRSYVNEIMLQTCCEEINHKLGYNYMCIVKENFFQKEYDKIKEHFSAMKHWGESDIDIFPKLIIKQLESDVCKDAGCVIEDIISKIVPPEPKETFFIPETIVSSSRRVNPKDKVKDIMKTSESVVKRSLQNTLIVLTTPSVPPVKTPSSAGLSSPKKLSASSTKTSKALMNTISKYNVQEEELTSQKEQTPGVVIDPNLDKELKRNQDSDSVLSSGTEQDGLRVVRLRTSYNRPLELGDSDEEKEVGLSVPVQGSVEIGPSIEGDAVTDNLQAEEISDNDFSDTDLLDVHSPEADKAAPNSQKQPHKKSMHSKYCPKRKAWIRSDSQQSVGEKESLRNVHSPSSEVSTIGKSSKRYSSHFPKKYDERSQDSYTSRASKRRRSTSSSPSLEEFLRKLSPSPVRKRSPLRVSSSYRKPVSRKKSRSPYRRRTRSPTSRHSRSPYRKRSKSPFRRRSKSPIRRRPSPYRKRSRSPVRRRSRSPFKLRSRSPIRKLSRSPIRKRSRSPRNRSPLRRRSRSPYSSFKSKRNERSLRSPVRISGGYKISRSPDKLQRKYSSSPSRQHARPRSPLADSGMPSRIPGSYKKTSSSTLPHHHPKTESRKERNDLEEISDEDESKYFNTNTSSEKIPQYMDEIIQSLPESARIMLVKVMQRFSITNINVNDPSFYELMKFVASHSSEIQRLMSQPSALPEMNAQVPSKPSAQSQESFLHQYILTGMKGNSNMLSEAGPSSANVFPGPSGINFQLPPLQPMSPSPQFLSQGPDLTPLNQFGQSVYQQPTSSVGYPVQGMHVASPNFVRQQQQMAMNIPMAQQQFQQDVYKQVSPPKPAIPPPQPKRTSEGMFQDLKATVSKIFGGEDALGKLGFKIPGLTDHPAEAKYSGSSQNVPPINPVYQSLHDNKMGQYFKKEAPTQANDNFAKSYDKKEQAFISEASRETPHVPPPDAKVSFCDVQRAPMQKNLFPVVNNPQTSYKQDNVQASINDAKKSLAQRLAAVLVKVGMVDVPAHLLQEMLMKIGAFSLNPPQDISESEILTILRKLKYV